MGDLTYRKGLYELAAAYYGKAPQGDLSEERLLNCAEALHALGRNDEAAQLLEQIGETGEHAARRHLLAGRLAAERGDRDAAVESLSAALEADPLNGPAMMDLARLYIAGEEIDRARLVLERAARLAPVREQALLTLVQIEVGAGDYDRAIEILVKALELRSDPRLEDYLAEIRRIAATDR
jgi:tetratricopeptide (TPR) repeat protein